MPPGHCPHKLLFNRAGSLQSSVAQPNPHSPHNSNSIHAIVTKKTTVLAGNKGLWEHSRNLRGKVLAVETRKGRELLLEGINLPL